VLPLEFWVAAGVFGVVFAGGVDCPAAVVWADATPSANANTVNGSNKRFIFFELLRESIADFAFHTSMETGIGMLSC
jgi:hypothetical protein